VFICRLFPCKQLCWPQELWLPLLDTISWCWPIAGLANCEIDFTQKRLDISCLGNLFGSGYGEPLVCVLKQVVCILFSYTLHCKEACEIVNCQIFNQPVVGGPQSTKNYGQVESLDGLPIGPG